MHHLVHLLFLVMRHLCFSSSFSSSFRCSSFPHSIHPPFFPCFPVYSPPLPPLCIGLASLSSSPPFENARKIVLPSPLSAAMIPIHENVCTPQPHLIFLPRCNLMSPATQLKPTCPYLPILPCSDRQSTCPTFPSRASSPPELNSQHLKMRVEPITLLA